MYSFGYLLGSSLSIAGVGGLLSGIFSRSLRLALIRSLGFGVLEIIFLFWTSPASRVAPLFLVIALFWGVVGWIVVGRSIVKRRAHITKNFE